MITTIVAISAVGLGASALSRRSVRESTQWRATLTPLASIIGSGFLVIAPLLTAAVGSWAPVAMGAIVVLAYWIGSMMRFVITEVEPRLETDSPSLTLVDLDRLSRLLLGFAYVVSVAFYVRLMASFVVQGISDSENVAQLLTTAALAAIGAVGWRRGLRGLETLEELAVGAKLAIIGGLLAGLVAYAAADFSRLLDAYGPSGSPSEAWPTVRILAGTLLVVQGFEISRYLGGYYDRPTRVKSMRNAQFLSAGIYMAFAALGVGLFKSLPAEIDETAVLEVAAELTPLLVPLLLFAAVASQLSAAVADTAGGGEMLGGTTRWIRGSGIGYLIITGASIVAVWLADVFAIVSVASRAFAAYYFTQTLMALAVLARTRSLAHRRSKIVLYTSLLIVLGFVTLFATAVDG